MWQSIRGDGPKAPVPAQPPPGAAKSGVDQPDLVPRVSLDAEFRRVLPSFIDFDSISWIFIEFYAALSNLPSFI